MDSVLLWGNYPNIEVYDMHTDPQTEKTTINCQAIQTWLQREWYGGVDSVLLWGNYPNIDVYDMHTDPQTDIDNTINCKTILKMVTKRTVRWSG